MNQNQLEIIPSNFAVNPHGLSIFSIHLHHQYKHSVPDWFSTTFGKESVWYNISLQHFLSDEPLTEEEIEARNISAKHRDWLPHQNNNEEVKEEELTKGLCAIELLGYVRLGVDDPYMHDSIRYGPSFGSAELSWPSKNRNNLKSKGKNANSEKDISRTTSWHCITRAMYENWRREPSWLPSYWPIIIFCQGSDASMSCSDVMTDMLGKETSEQLSIQLSSRRKKWNSQFRVTILKKKEEIAATNANNFGSLPELNEHDESNKTPSIAVCGVIPYTTSDAEKVIANQAMFMEWIHYYSQLGMLVILYDRDGVYGSLLGGSTHEDALGGFQKNVIYLNYTVGGLLEVANLNASEVNQKHKGHHVFDNTEPRVNTNIDWKMRFLSQGFDKSKTLTLCRFDAKAKFNIEKVLVVDFDEFLFCRKAPSTSFGQRAYIEQLINSYRATGVHQLAFRQRITFNRTASPRDCVITMAAQNLSVFHCFGANRYWLTGHSVKSIHLDTRCLITGYHQSCPLQSTPRTVNCVCNSVDISEKICSIIHLSTKQEVYDTGHAKLEEKVDLEEARRAKSELWRIANYSIKRIPNIKNASNFILGASSALQIKVLH